jgi:hypothetical protein
LPRPDHPEAAGLTPWRKGLLETQWHQSWKSMPLWGCGTVFQEVDSNSLLSGQNTKVWQLKVKSTVAPLHVMPDEPSQNIFFVSP